MTFKDIPIGAKFVFKNPVEFSIGKTFWKTSTRGYREVGEVTPTYMVGTIKVAVTKLHK